MIALNHATLSTGIILAGSVLTGREFFLPLIIFVVFSSLLPDIDHPGSEVSKFFPLIHAVFPHRGVTHSFLGGLVFSLMLYILFGFDIIMSLLLIIAAVVGMLLLNKIMTKRVKQFQKMTKGFFSLAQIKLMINGITFFLTGFLILAAILIWNNELRVQMLTLLSIGYLTHLIGDIVTKEGIPLFWPLKQRIKIPLFRTGSVVESVIGAFLIGWNGYYLYEFITVYNLTQLDYWLKYVTF